MGMAGEGNDPDDLIVQAFKAYDNGGKMTKAEIDDIFGEFEIDEDYMIKTKMSLVFLWPSRKNLRLRNLLQLRRILWRRRRMLMLRRRRRRRRRLPSKKSFFASNRQHSIHDLTMLSNSSVVSINIFDQ